MKDQITITVDFKKNTPEVREAIQTIAEGISSENLKAVSVKLKKLGPDEFNKKLSKGLTFI